MSQHPQGYEQQQQQHPQNNMGPGQTSSNYGGPYVHGYGNTSNENAKYDKYSRSVPEFHHNGHRDGYYDEHRDGRPNEMRSDEKLQRDYLGNPLYGPPGYSDAHMQHPRSSFVGDGTRGIKDFFYKPPPEDYMGTYGADYKPEISKTKVGIILAGIGMAAGYGIYRHQRKKQREQERHYPRYGNEYYGYEGYNRSYDDTGHGGSHGYNPYGNYHGY